MARPNKTEEIKKVAAPADTKETAVKAEAPKKEIKEPAKAEPTKKENAAAAKNVETIKPVTEKPAEKKSAETAKKAADTKKKADAKKPAEKKATPAKKTSTKAAPAAKKAAAPKAAKIETKSVLQVAGNEFDFDKVIKAVESLKTKNKGKSLEIYIKPEDRAIYYVVNGKGGKKVDL